MRLKKRDWWARQINRGERGKYWMQTLYFPLTVFIALKQFMFQNIPVSANIAILTGLIPLSLAIMWLVGFFDENHGIWSHQIEHKQAKVNPIQGKVYAHILDIKKEIGLEVDYDKEELRYVPEAYR